MKTLTRCLFLTLLATPTLAEAQTSCGLPTQTSCPVQAQKAFTVTADHAPDDAAGDTTGYRLYIDGTAVQTKPRSALSALVNGVGSIAFSVTAGLPKGTHVIYVEAYGDGGATGSQALTLVMTPGKPKAPENIKVVTP